MATVNTTVHVHGPDGTTVFAPGETLPAWAVEAITNPEVLVKEEPADADAEVSVKDRPTSRRRTGGNAAS